ncbi:MAG: hypothetical protein GY771_17470 [bacterium]|nr:hypothetical protein [bacterium]
MSRRAIITAIIAAVVGTITPAVYADEDGGEDAIVNLSLLNGGNYVIIYIDNEDVGFNPLPEQVLERGDHEISIRPFFTYRPMDFTLAAVAGEKYNVHFGLIPLNKDPSFNWRVFFITTGLASVAFGLLLWIGVANSEWR